MLPFYVVYWLESGNQHPMMQVPLVGSLTVESAMFGLFLGVAVLALPLWYFLSKRLNKHIAYIVGISVWLVAQFLFLFIQPGQRSNRGLGWTRRLGRQRRPYFDACAAAGQPCD